MHGQLLPSLLQAWPPPDSPGHPAPALTPEQGLQWAWLKWAALAQTRRHTRWPQNHELNIWLLVQATVIWRHLSGNKSWLIQTFSLFSWATFPEMNFIGRRASTLTILQFASSDDHKSWQTVYLSIPQPQSGLATMSGSYIFQDFSSGIGMRSWRCRWVEGGPGPHTHLRCGRCTGLAILPSGLMRATLAEAVLWLSLTHPLRARFLGVEQLMQQEREAGGNGVCLPEAYSSRGERKRAATQTLAPMSRLPVKYILTPALLPATQPLPSSECHCSGLR